MKYALVVLIILLCRSVASAMEYKDNPDRFPSIGLAYSNTDISGTGKLKASGFSVSQDAKETGDSINADVRIPLSNNFTLMGGVGFVSDKTTFDETTRLVGSETNLKGHTITIGGRYYLH